MLRHNEKVSLCLMIKVFFRLFLQCFVPSKVEGLLQRESELIGRLHYKEGHDLYHWRVGWFTLEGSGLHFSSGGGEGTEEGMLQLKQLQELSKPVHYLFFLCFIFHSFESFTYLFSLHTQNRLILITSFFLSCIDLFLTLSS